MIKLYKGCCVFLGCLMLVILHFFHLSSIPGLHYDEAWAMNYAWRIAHEPQFWPITAMSPYTAPWAHYWAALWMKLLGPSVLVYRGSQVTLALAGFVCLGLALPRNLRAAFPWALLLLPGLVLNERFTIELTGLHVLCFGGLLLALRKEKFTLACLAAIVGTTAHVLFYATSLSLVGLTMLQAAPLGARARRNAIVYFALMAFFFTHVLAEIPEKGKGAALLLSCLFMGALLTVKAERWPFWRKPLWIWLLHIAGLIYGFNCLFFAQGFWGAEIATGYPLSLIPYETLLFWIGSLGLCIACARGWVAAPLWARRACLLLTVSSGLLMLKPAPRYFELPILALATLLTFDLASWLYTVEWPPSRRAHLLTALAGVMALNLGLSLSHYALMPPSDSPLHFLLFQDSSRDFLDKQGLVRFLGGSGCSRSDIHTDDPRLKEELDALALGDWPIDQRGACKWNFVARRSDLNAVGESWHEFKLRRKN